MICCLRGTKVNIPKLFTIAGFASRIVQMGFWAFYHFFLYSDISSPEYENRIMSYDYHNKIKMADIFCKEFITWLYTLKAAQQNLITMRIMNMHNAQNPHSSHLKKEDNNLCYVIVPFHEIFQLNTFHSFKLRYGIFKFIKTWMLLCQKTKSILPILCQLSQLYVHFLA